jgi:hypothetical protein
MEGQPAKSRNGKKRGGLTIRCHERSSCSLELLPKYTPSTPQADSRLLAVVSALVTDVVGVLHR